MRSLCAGAAFTWILRHVRAHSSEMTTRRSAGSHHGPKETLPALMLGAIGVVFGDIGTSPLYAMKESFIGPHPLAVDPAHIFGVLSLIFWTLMMVVTVKYVLVAMRADNKGEGGSFALLAMISRRIEGGKWTAGLVTLGVLATALFYGDAIITPAISVLSAVEGLSVAEPRLAGLILPISIGILVGLFLIQARGTAKVGAAVRADRPRLFRHARRARRHQYRGASRNLRRAEPLLGGQLLRDRSGQGVPRAGLGRAGRDRRRNALRRHGPFRAQGDRASAG